MDFETPEWDAEAKRIARAFRVVGECALVEDADGSTRKLQRPMNWFAVIKARVINGRELYARQAPFRVPTEDGLFLTVSYLLNPDVFRKVFALSDTEIVYNKRGDTGLRFDRHGAALFTPSYKNIYAQQMAKGLFHLDLLSPEAEVALGVAISAHEKMEWALEYEARYDV